KLVADATASTTFFLDQADLKSVGTITGTTAGADKLVIVGNLDLTSTALSDVETLEAGKSSATTFTVDSADLADVTAITGSSGGADTLIVKGGTADFGATNLTSIETIKSGQAGTTDFTLQDE